jgi:hypothetical protein
MYCRFWLSSSLSHPTILHTDRTGSHCITGRSTIIMGMMFMQGLGVTNKLRRVVGSKFTEPTSRQTQPGKAMCLNAIKLYASTTRDEEPRIETRQIDGHEAKENNELREGSYSSSSSAATTHLFMSTGA